MRSVPPQGIRAALGATGVLDQVRVKILPCGYRVRSLMVFEDPLLSSAVDLAKAVDARARGGCPPWGATVEHQNGGKTCKKHCETHRKLTARLRQARPMMYKC